MYRAPALQTRDCGREGGTCWSDCHPRASRLDPHRPLQPPVHGGHSCTPAEGQLHQRKQGTFIQTHQGYSQCQKIILSFFNKYLNLQNLIIDFYFFFGFP